jgi:hypothetical protein
MSGENVKLGDKQAAAIVAGGNNAFVMEAPWFSMDFECHGPEGVRWRDAMTHNVVVDQGKGYLINRAFGSITATTAGAVLALHSATTASNNVWSNISASQVISYGASCPAITFASTHTASPATCTASYAFTASTQTCSGAAVLLYTSASMGTNAATADIKMYAYGTFNASRLVQSADTLSVTVSLNFA